MVIELGRSQVKDGGIVGQNNKQDQTDGLKISAINGGGFAIPRSQSIFKSKRNIEFNKRNN